MCSRVKQCKDGLSADAGVGCAWHRSFGSRHKTDRSKHDGGSVGEAAGSTARGDHGHQDSATRCRGVGRTRGLKPKITLYGGRHHAGKRDSTSRKPYLTYQSSSPVQRNLGTGPSANSSYHGPDGITWWIAMCCENGTFSRLPLPKELLTPYSNRMYVTENHSREPWAAAAGHNRLRCMSSCASGMPQSTGS